MRKLVFIKSVVLTVSILLFSNISAYAAEWVIDTDSSQLNFISIKKGTVAETHQFNKFEGQLNSHGQFELNIDLASVDTNIEVRDDRMKKHLFDVDSFSTSSLTANIDLALLDAIDEGRSVAVLVDTKLELHGVTMPVQLNVIITRLVGAKLSVVSVEPVIINAADYSLVSGVNKLMEIAKLPSISHAVPVSFYLILNLKQ